MTDTFDRVALQADITRFEGRRKLVYDDATSATIEPGTTVEGWASIGVGRNLVGKGLSDLEIDILWNNDVDELCAFYDERYPWWRQMTPPRQQALINFGFVGIGTVMSFATFLALLEAGNYEGAAADFLGTEYARQLPERAAFIADQIKTG